MAAPFLSLDPFESGDQEEYMEVRAALNWNCRLDELFEQWFAALAERFPDDKAKRERLILALQLEAETWQRASQEMLQKKEEQKDKKKKRKPKRRDVEFPEDFDWLKAYFVRATVAGKTDKCSPRDRQHIGVPLINEDRPQYRRDEWEIPPKAAYLEGAQPKSEPTAPAPMEEPI